MRKIKTLLLMCEGFLSLYGNRCLPKYVTETTQHMQENKTKAE